THTPVARQIQNSRIEKTETNGVRPSEPPASLPGLAASSVGSRSISAARSPRVLITHSTAHTSPTAPTVTNSARQPSPVLRWTTLATSGVVAPPRTLAPLRKLPLPPPRPSRGRIRPVPPTAQGQLTASPIPSATRQAIISPIAPAGTNPVSTPAALHNRIANR